LQTIGGSADFRLSDITSTNNLEIIGKDAYLFVNAPKSFKDGLQNIVKGKIIIQ